MQDEDHPQSEATRSTGTPRLAAFLREQKDLLLGRWEARIRSEVPVLADADAQSLRLGPAELLDQIASLLAGDPLAEPYSSVRSAGARRHATARRQVPGYAAVDIMTEYHLLREELVASLTAADGWSAHTAALVHARLDRAMRDVLEQLEALPESLSVPDLSVKSPVDLTRERDDAERERRTFICRIYRELRNPLLMMGGRAEVLRNAEISVEQRRQYGAILARMCEKQGGILEDLLEASRLLAPRWYCGSYPLDLATVLGAAHEEIQALAVEQQLVLAVTPPERRLLVRGDGHWLERALVQLLRNAVEHSHPGGRIWLAAARQGNEAVIGVRDHGVGIHPAMLPRIFEPLVSDDRGRHSRTARGWGLGLPIARSIVESHGGTLAAFSPGEDQGSDFVIRIPTLPESVRPFRHVLRVREHCRMDDCFDREFQHVGSTIRHVDSEQSALAAVQQQRPEAVIIDFDCSAPDGVALAYRLRKMLQPQPPQFIAYLSDLPFEPQPDLGDAFDRLAAWTGQSEGLRDLALTDEGLS